LEQRSSANDRNRDELSHAHKKASFLSSWQLLPRRIYAVCKLIYIGSSSQKRAAQADNGLKTWEESMDPIAAKQFLISRVIEEAEVEHVSLSEIEKKMLHFSEARPSLPDMYEVNDQFEESYDSGDYEAKVASLLRNARDHDRQASPRGDQQWAEALDALKTKITTSW
jgi:hypothetical protein